MRPILQIVRSSSWRIVACSSLVQALLRSGTCSELAEGALRGSAVLPFPFHKGAPWTQLFSRRHTMGKLTFRRVVTTLKRTLFISSLPIAGGTLFLIGSFCFWPGSSEHTNTVGALCFLVGSLCYWAAPFLDFWELTHNYSNLLEPPPDISDALTSHDTYRMAAVYEHLYKSHILRIQCVNCLVYMVRGCESAARAASPVHCCVPQLECSSLYCCAAACGSSAAASSWQARRSSSRRWRRSSTTADGCTLQAASSPSPARCSRCSLPLR
jgi:hypothetical protein